jgi:hypothetical protein
MYRNTFDILGSTERHDKAANCMAECILEARVRVETLIAEKDKQSCNAVLLLVCMKCAALM